MANNIVSPSDGNFLNHPEGYLLEPMENAEASDALVEKYWPTLVKVHPQYRRETFMRLLSEQEKRQLAVGLNALDPDPANRIPIDVMPNTQPRTSGVTDVSGVTLTQKEIDTIKSSTGIVDAQKQLIDMELEQKQDEAYRRKHNNY